VRVFDASDRCVGHTSAGARTEHRRCSTWARLAPLAQAIRLYINATHEIVLCFASEEQIIQHVILNLMLSSQNKEVLTTGPFNFRGSSDAARAAHDAAALPPTSTTQQERVATCELSRTRLISGCRQLFESTTAHIVTVTLTRYFWRVPSSPR
jgi:hypothetical protein